MKDIIVKFDPVGFFVINGDDWTMLKSIPVITRTNNATVKLPLSSVAENVYEPLAEAAKYTEVIADATVKKAEAEAIAAAVEAVKDEPPKDAEPVPAEEIK